MKNFRQLFQSTEANILMIAGLAMPILIGFAGLATDTIQWTLDKRELQRTADSAALAGAYAIAQQGNAIQSAKDSISYNNSLALVDAPIIANSPTSGSYAGNQNAISVELRTRRTLPFSSLFLAAGPLISAHSTAAMISSGKYCVISLDQSSSTGIEASGDANIDLQCGIFSNSRGSEAVDIGGSAQTDTDIVGAVGGIPPSNRYGSGVKLMPYAVPQPDPFKSLPDPSLSNCSGKVDVKSNQTQVLTPGCYSGIDIKGTVNFQPGIYYIDGDELSFGGGAIANGSGVTFILSSRSAATKPSSIAELSINGTATLNLKSPTSGQYAGLLFYQDRRAKSGTTKINGNSNAVLEGAIYLPSQKIEFNGNSGFTTQCVQLVGSQIKFTGNTSISNACPVSGAKSFDGAVIRLVA